MMFNPYERKLREIGTETQPEVTLERAGAPPVKGKLTKIEDDGCTIGVDREDATAITNVFIAYSDIRGISTVEWNYANL